MPDEDTPDRESPPDEASFRNPGVATGAAGHSMAATAPGGAGGQKAIDQFTDAVTKLDDIVNKMAAQQGGGGGGGFPKMGQQSSNATSFPKMGTPSFGGQDGGQTKWTMQPGAYNDQGEPQAYSTPPAGNGGAPPFPAAQTPPSSSPTSQPTQNQQAATSMKEATKPTLGGILGGVAAAAISFGQSQLSGQLALNAYQMQSGLGAPAGMSSAQVYKQAANQALGTGGGTGNILAQNPTDAIAEWSTLQQVSGTSFLGQTQLGQAATGATGAFSYTNPGITAQQAAQQTAKMYNPMTSMKMRMLGYQKTPEKIGGGANDIGSVAASIFQRWGMNTKNPRFAQGIRASLAPGHTGAINLAQLGQDNPTMVNTMEGMAQAMNGPNGMSEQQASQSFDTLAKTSSSRQAKTSAENLLKKHGVQQSLMSDVQTANAPKGEQMADQSKAYAQSLASTTQALANFRAGLNEFFDKSGLNSMMGHAGGFGAGAGLMGGGIGGGIVGGLLGKAGGGLLGKVLGKGVKGVFGKGGAGDAAGGAEGGAAEGGAAASAGLLPTLGLAVGGELGVQMAHSAANNMAPGRGRSWAKAGTDYISDPLNPVKGVADTAKDIWHGLWGGGASINANTIQEKQRGRGDTNVGQGSVSKQAENAVHAASQQVGVPYAYGKEESGKGFDCSGLTQWAYKQAGISLPRLAKEQEAYLKSKGRDIPVNKAEEGDLVFGNGAQGPFSHVAMLIAHNQIVAADSAGTQVRIRGFEPHEWTEAGRPAGNVSGKTLTPKANPRGGPKPDEVGKYGITTGDQGDPTVNLGGNTHGFQVGMGAGDEAATAGSSDETASVGSAVTGGIQAGSGWNGQYRPPTSGGETKGNNGGGGGGVSGTGGKAVYNYLLNNIFSGHKIAAAGATASIWGESAWSPEAQGSGGRGLIGWTPPSTLPDSAFTGNATKDMASQLPLVKKFIQTSGDQGVITTMLKDKTIMAAANHWGVGVERYGINDVHSEGIELAASIAGLPKSVEGLWAGGHVESGKMVLAGERGPELITVHDDVDVYNSAQTSDMLKASAKKSPGGPWAAGSGATQQFSPYTPAYSGGVPQNSSGGDLYLNFGSGSIKINVSGGTGSGGTGSGGTGNTQAIAESMVKHLNKQEMYTQIKQGKM